MIILLAAVNSQMIINYYMLEFFKTFQFCVNDKFKLLWSFKLLGGYITNICFVSSSIILTLYFNRSIIKIYVNKKLILLTILV